MISHFIKFDKLLEQVLVIREDLYFSKMFPLIHLSDSKNVKINFECLFQSDI